MEDKPESIKITLLGSPGVGKTCIIRRYISNYFEENYTSTTVTYFQKIITRDNKHYQLDVWDTAGQEKFRSLGRNFYKDSFIVILVYDITRIDSFEGLKKIWYPDLLQYGEKNPIIAVVGNKCDRYEEPDIVNEDEARKFAEEIKAQYMIVSAKNNINIQNLFSKLVDLYFDPNCQEDVAIKKSQRRNSTKLVNNNNTNEEKKKKGCC